MRTRADMIRTFSLCLLCALLIGTVGLTGCGEEVDETAQTSLEEAGYGTQSAAELSRLDLSAEEVEQLAIARRGGLDDAAAARIVKALHDDGLAFDIGMEMQTLAGAGFSATALVELVEMGAVRPWESDLRVMKHAGISEPTILAIARLKFEEESDDVLSGKDYERLKMSGLSDAAIEQFVREGGSRQQMQEIELAVRQGTSEQAALREAGLD